MKKPQKLRKGTLVAKSGIQGMVVGADPEGNALVHWYNGSMSRLLPGEDELTIVTDGKEDVREEILNLRDTGLTNMFDLPRVQTLSRQFGYKALLALLAHDRKAYTHFIFTGRLA